jgi:hypothetical protein
MAQLDVTNIAAASIATPAAGVTSLFVDTADSRIKTKDSAGSISILNNDGLQDRNIVTNGGFAVQQRVATASTAIPAVSTTTRAGQVADRWAVTVGNVTTPSWAQIDTAAAVEAGMGSRYYGKITQATNAAKFILSQFITNIEMAHLRGTKVRVGCKIKQFVGANAVYRLGLLQLAAAGTVDVCPTFISAIGAASVEPTWGTNLLAITPDASPVGENGTISGVALSITSTAGWVKSSCVFTIPTDSKNLVLVIYRDTLGAASDAVGITEVQLTQGADLVDWVPYPFALELNHCQRFFQKSFPQATVPAASAVSNGATFGIIGKAGAVALAAKMFIRFPVTMWKVPTTLTLFTPTAAGAVPFRIDGTTPAAQTAVAQSLLTDNGAFVSATGDANGAVGDAVCVHWTAEAEFVT